MLQSVDVSGVVCHVDGVQRQFLVSTSLVPTSFPAGGVLAEPGPASGEMNHAAQVGQNAELKDMYQTMGFEALRQSSAFEGSPVPMLQFLVQNRARVRQIQQGDMLQTIAGSGEGIVIIVEGNANKTDTHGSTVASLGPRAIVGEETLFGQKTQHNCQATTPIVALVLTRIDIDLALEKFPGEGQLHQHLNRQSMGNGPAGASRSGMNRRDFVKAVPLFQGMPPRMIEDLQVRLKSDFFPANTWIVTEGEIGDAMYFIAEGGCDVVSMATNSVLSSLRTGDFFGEMACLFNETRISSVRTKVPTSVFRLAASDLAASLDQFPQFREVVLMIGQQRRNKTITGGVTAGSQVYKALYRLLRGISNGTCALFCD